MVSMHSGSCSSAMAVRPPRTLGSGIAVARSMHWSTDCARSAPNNSGLAASEPPIGQNHTTWAHLPELLKAVLLSRTDTG